MMQLNYKKKKGPRAPTPHCTELIVKEGDGYIGYDPRNLFTTTNLIANWLNHMLWSTNSQTIAAPNTTDCSKRIST